MNRENLSSADAARLVLADPFSFWTALMHLCVFILSKSPTISLSNTVGLVFERFLLSQGRTQAHVRFVIAFTVAKYYSCIVPCLLGRLDLNGAFWGAITVTLRNAELPAAALPIREELCRNMLQQLEQASSSDQAKTNCIVKQSEFGSIFREISAVSAASDASGVVATYRSRFLSELVLMKQKHSAMLLPPTSGLHPRDMLRVGIVQGDLTDFLVSLFCTVPLQNIDVEEWRQLLAFLLDFPESANLSQAFTILNRHLLACAPKNPKNFEQFFLITFETLGAVLSPQTNAQMVRVSQEPLRECAVLATYKFLSMVKKLIILDRALTELFNNDNLTPVFQSYAPCAALWPRLIPFIEKTITSCLLSMEEKVLGTTRRLASVFLHFIDLTPQNYQVPSELITGLQPHILESITASAYFSRSDVGLLKVLHLLLELSPSSASEISSQLIVKLASFSENSGTTDCQIQILFKLVNMPNYLATRLTTPQDQQTFSNSILAFLLTYSTKGAQFKSAVILSLFCIEYPPDTLRRLGERLFKRRFLTQDAVEAVLQLACRIIASAPAEAAQFLGTDEGADLARLFFCSAPSLDMKNLQYDLCLNTAMSLLQAAQPADALLDTMQREWRDERKPASKVDQIQLISNFDESSFMEEMLSALRPELDSDDNDERVIIQAPSFQQQRQWLQTIVSALPKQNQKLRMLVMMRLP